MIYSEKSSLHFVSENNPTQCVCPRVKHSLLITLSSFFAGPLARDKLVEKA